MPTSFTPADPAISRIDKAMQDRPMLPAEDGPLALSDPEPHPLTRFLDLDMKPVPPRMVVPGFVQAGICVFAGAHGVGKTTAIVPMAMIVAGLHARRDPLAPRHWRHVVYIAEDVAQVQRIVAGLVEQAGLGIDPADVRERFHVVPAVRMAAEQVASVGPTYAQMFARDVDGVDLPPLIVIDTRSATVEVRDENDNAEAGRTVALFKQRFAGLPLWLIGHLAKGNLSRQEVQTLSIRGASAIEADAHQVVFLVAESDGRRFMVLGKRRFEPRWPELEIQSGTAEVTAVDEYGQSTALTLRWGLPVPPTMSRAEAREDREEQERRERGNERRAAILDAVAAAERAGLPLSRNDIADAVRGNREDVKACIRLLEREQWLYPVEVPTELRRHHNRKEFLICLSEVERRAILNGDALPPERLKVPASWVKPIGSPSEPMEGQEPSA